jgi:hypothetical protein
MDRDDYIESEEFPGPMVRVRGRLSRSGEVSWSPCLRTYKGWRMSEGGDESRSESAEETSLGGEGRHVVVFLDYRGEIVARRLVSPRFSASEQEWATFAARIPYRPETQAVALLAGERELGRLDVPTDRPFFTLLRPTEDEFIDPNGVLHLHWAGHDSEHPMTFFVRYSHNGRDWLRPGVNLHCNDYYLDLREMPGGKRCRAEVIATNGYRTSYACTRHFEVPEKPVEVLLGENDGPLLFVQGFSREHGPITDRGIEWLVRGEVVRTGGTLDARTIPAGTHEIRARLTAPDGREAIALVGSYDAKTGIRTGPPPGL